MSNFYNEIYDSNGQIRNHYLPIYEAWKPLKASDKKKLFSRSKKLFSGDYMLDPVPRIITGEEFSEVRNGVIQRAKTLQMFLLDYYRKGRTWKKVIPPGILKLIVERHRHSNLLDCLNPKTLTFPYGPDIMRDRVGNWRVIEDNIGPVGGFGDLVASRKILNQLMPKYRSFIKTANNPLQFYSDLAMYFRRQAQLKSGMALFFSRPYSLEPDNETKRLAEIFKSQEIEVMTWKSKTKKLLLEDNGVFFKESGRKRKRVGYLILYLNPESIDWENYAFALQIDLSRYKVDKHHPASVKRLLNQMILTPVGKCIQKAIINGSVLSSFSPGVTFVSDKMFGLYMEPLIEEYLKETPILKNVSGGSFLSRNKNGSWQLDKTLLNRVFRNQEKYVIKRADADCGSHVWIGCKLSKQKFVRIKENICENPDRYIYQDYEHLSVVENRIVDIRLHTLVGYDEIIVSNTPWGRSNWINGDGKVNISTGGMTSPVVVL